MARKTNPNLYTPMTRHEVDQALLSIAGATAVEDIPGSFIRELAASNEAQNRMLAARFRFTDPETLMELAQDRDLNVRAAIASNTSARFDLISTVLDREVIAGFAYKLKNKDARTALFNAVCNAPAASLDTLELLVGLAGKESPAGRYARERIRLAATRVEMDARRARLKAEKEAAVAQTV